MKLRSIVALGALAAGAAYLFRKSKEENQVIHVKEVKRSAAADETVDRDFSVEAPVSREVVIATNNKSKVEELKRMLEPLGFTVFSLKDKKISVDVEETGETFAENALIKARAIYELVKCPVIADDSGLCVDALGGAPGVYSARYSGEGDKANNKKLLAEMEGVTDRAAQFVCVIAYLDENGSSHTFTGICHGEVGFEERGSFGFGYDPLFMIGDRSVAELTPEEKDAVSHRGDAIRKLVAYLSEQQ